MKRILLTAATLMILSSVTVYASKSTETVKKQAKMECCKKSCETSSGCHKTSCNSEAVCK